ncbi:MAG: molybdenum cofactor guanylyltransferase MobA [Sphingobacteriales bacterium]|nr:MAG: molybdenum cofactor guanylyltransferase MobA [Sphingobacteriales bacterium]
MKSNELVVGIILAGGLARRMGGGDKCLLPLAGKTLLQRTVERAQPQVSKLLLNANGSSLRFARLRLPVLPDNFPNNPGPLAGIHAGFKWMQTNTPDAQWLASFASDSPFFPDDLVERFYQKTLTEFNPLVVAVSKLQMHPVFGLWHISLLPKIETLLNTGEVPRLLDWVSAQKATQVDFIAESYDPFFNINTPQDLYSAEPLAALVK